MAIIRTADVGRERSSRNPPRQGTGPQQFVNPYPWMSAVEAMVHLALEEHKVPFSWRFFDGTYAPNFTQLMTRNGWQPEFTLREYNAVILVEGGFFGTLPSVINNVALATVLLQADGWTVVTLFEADILHTGAWTLLQKELPSIGSITGPVRPNPYGHPDLMTSSKKRHHRQMTVKLKHFRDRAAITHESDKHDHTRTIHRSGRRFGDTGRTRSERIGAVSGRHKTRGAPRGGVWN